MQWYHVINKLFSDELSVSRGHAAPDAELPSGASEVAFGKSGAVAELSHLKIGLCRCWADTGR